MKIWKEKEIGNKDNRISNHSFFVVIYKENNDYIPKVIEDSGSNIEVLSFITLYPSSVIYKKFKNETRASACAVSLIINNKATNEYILKRYIESKENAKAILKGTLNFSKLNIER